MPFESNAAFGKRDQRTITGVSLRDMRRLLSIHGEYQFAEGLLFDRLVRDTKVFECPGYSGQEGFRPAPSVNASARQSSLTVVIAR